MTDSFRHCILGKTGLRACRLGFSGTYRPGIETVRVAIDEGINFFFYFPFDVQTVKALKTAIKSNRDNLILCTGAYNLIWWKTDLRKVLERRLRQMSTDCLDIFLFLGVLKESHLENGVIEKMARFKEEGKIKAFGISTHNRGLAGKLSGGGALDALMIRYNAAHRGAEHDIFPYLAGHNPGIISYTATRWRYLLRRPRGWPEDKPVPSPDMAYRFVLSNHNVDICLTAPANTTQLRQNLKALEKGFLSDEEMRFMRDFGDAVHEAGNRGLHRILPFSRA